MQESSGRPIRNRNRGKEGVSATEESSKVKEDVFTGTSPISHSLNLNETIKRVSE